MMTAIQRRAALVTALLLSLALAACGGADPQAADETAPEVAASPADAVQTADAVPTGDAAPTEPDTPVETEEAAGEQELATVRMAALPLANYTIFKAAEDQGFLEEAGIELETTYVPQGAVALEALMGGSVDVAFPAHLEFIQAAAVRPDLRILMGFTRLPDSGPDNTAFLVREDSGIESVADLAGKRIAAGLLNSINHFYTRLWLQEHGVDPASVSFAEVPFPNMMDALDNGQVDGVFNVEPFVTVMTAQGGYRILGHPYMEVNPGFTIITPTVRQEWLDENLDVAERLVTAFTRGAAYLEEASEEERVALVSEFTEIDEALVAQMQLPIYDTDVRVGTVQRTADLMLEDGMIDQEVDVGPLVAETATVAG